MFRWLPCITWDASDALGICGGAKIVRLGVPSDGNAAAGAAGAGAGLTTMYRSPRDCRRAMSGGTQQTLMSHALTDSTERVDCCAVVGGAATSTSTTDRSGGLTAASASRQQSAGLQLRTLVPGTAAAAAASAKRQSTSPRTREDSF